MSQCSWAVGLAYVSAYPGLFIVPGLRLSLQKQVAGSPMVCLFVCLFFHYLEVPFRLSKLNFMTRLHIHMFTIILIMNYLNILPLLRCP